MAKKKEAAPKGDPKAVGQRASVSIGIGQTVRFEAELRITPAGLLAVTGLVSGILLSTAVLVREAKQRRLAPRATLLSLPNRVEP